jgi:UDP-N-acetylmuramate--alanine ligase
VYIDDYAHHQQVMRCIKQFESCIQIKSLGHFLICLVERDFADDFAKSLSAFDEIILLDIYPHVNYYGGNKLTMVDG